MSGIHFIGHTYTWWYWEYVLYMHVHVISLTWNDVPVAVLFSVVQLLAPIRRKSVIFFVMSSKFSQFLSKEISH